MKRALDHAIGEEGAHLSGSNNNRGHRYHNFSAFDSQDSASSASDDDFLFGCGNRSVGSQSNDSNNNAPCFFPILFPPPNKRHATMAASTTAPSSSSSIFSAASPFRWSRAPEEPQNNASYLTEAEALIAKEMDNLSINEREMVYEDIHGVSQATEEKEEFVRSCLGELDREISKVRLKSEYDKAIFLNPGYVKDANFRLMFLRSDMFNAHKAAKRMVEHFRIKLELFGMQKLSKRIHWTDLSEDDQATYATGAIQMFPSCKDRSGRALFYNIYMYRADKSISNLLRAYWYCIMTCVQDDVETQRKGAVAISYTIGCPMSTFYSQMAKQSKHVIVNGIPVRVTGGHFCFEDQRIRPLFSLLLSAAPKSWLLRFRPHFGTHMECHYSLNSFGISADAIPVDKDGNLRWGMFEENHARVLRKERAVESELSLARGDDRYDIPKENDVLLGRGWSFQRYPGTVTMMSMVEEAKPKHDRAKSRNEKTAICMEIVNEIRANGGRFLKREGEYWVEVGSDIAREKCAQGFRNLSRKTRVVVADHGSTDDDGEKMSTKTSTKSKKKEGGSGSGSGSKIKSKSKSKQNS
mmetsp:Transcript_2964/g.8307  ORF Transcript_2964/g.8307 Transcript_2964/m.8307 type:complete len:581 (-) Transcript_2964:82-1824(-)